MYKRDFRILIADDDEIVREVVCSILSKEGYNVLCAKDGIEAIRLISIEEINLVIKTSECLVQKGLKCLDML